MDKRTSYWGNFGITLLFDGVPLWFYPFPVGDSGPVSGCKGTELWDEHEAIAEQWVSIGNVPPGCAKAGVGPDSN